MKKLNELKKKKGITLMALVITVIVMLILAGVVFNLTIGENGMINMAQKASEIYKAEQEKEDENLSQYASLISQYVNNPKNVGDMTTDELKEYIEAIIETKMDSDESTDAKDTTPAGTVISYITGSTAPNGYLTCDGSVYNISDYPKLAKSIYDGFGKYDYYGGDGTTTFAVPDLRGEFLRGTGTNQHAYSGSGSEVGVHQAPTLSTHVFSDASNITVTGNVEFADWMGVYSSADTYKYVGAATANFNKNRISFRPTNTSVLYCIKY